MCCSLFQTCCLLCCWPNKALLTSLCFFCLRRPFLSHALAHAAPQLVFCSSKQSDDFVDCLRSFCDSQSTAESALQERQDGEPPEGADEQEGGKAESSSCFLAMEKASLFGYETAKQRLLSAVVDTVPPDLHGNENFLNHMVCCCFLLQQPLLFWARLQCASSSSSREEQSLQELGTLGSSCLFFAVAGGPVEGGPGSRCRSPSRRPAERRAHAVYGLEHVRRDVHSARRSHRDVSRRLPHRGACATAASASLLTTASRPAGFCRGTEDAHLRPF